MSVIVSATERTKILSVVGGMAIDGSTITDESVTTSELGGSGAIYIICW